VSPTQPAGESPKPELRAAEDPDSPRARARALRAKLAEDKTIELVVPGYAGLLGVRYRPIPENDWRELASRIERSGGTMDAATGLEVALDVVIGACECLLWRDDPDQPWGIVEDDAGQPLRFDVRTAEWLGFEASSAREVVRGVFSPEGTKPISPAVHGDAVAEWLRGNATAINRTLLGK
jgi:hypothetical protein